MRVRDEHNASVEGNFSVNLLDLPENPYGLSSSSELRIAENHPVGSFVTVFTATDPDVNATLKYYLYDENATPGNAYFELDLNGTLRTTAVLGLRDECESSDPSACLRRASSLCRR